MRPLNMARGRHSIIDTCAGPRRACGSICFAHWLRLVGRLRRVLSAVFAVKAHRSAAGGKGGSVHRPFARRPHYHVHFTPTSASWTNEVERWFAELTRK